MSILRVVFAFTVQVNEMSGMSFFTTRKFQSDEFYTAKSEFYVALSKFDLSSLRLDEIKASKDKCVGFVNREIQEDGVFLIEACAGLANVLFKVNENVALDENEYELLIVHSSDQSACIGGINLKAFLEKNRNRINVKKK
jgi:hypothetical protein